MRREEVLLKDLRYFKPVGGRKSSLLGREGVVEAGTRITLGTPESRIYDHRDQTVIPFLAEEEGVSGWLLMSELDMPELTN